jgi:phosphoesterase RecJ-like protein
MVEKKYIKYLIKKYENISLFFHEYPDGDALGSVYGFLSFLKKEYPQKKVSIVGATKIDMHYYEKFLPVDTLEEPDDKFIQNSLGIVCDCANSSRVFTQKHLLCKKLINIDHHQNNELFGTTN